MANNITIIKRDGTKEFFNKEKIINAVLKAFLSVDGEITEYAKIKANNIANYIEGLAEGAPEDLDIETIQDKVEAGIMACKRKDVAREYITYRNARNSTRYWNSQLMQAAKDKLLAIKIDNSNANMDENSFGGRRGEAESVWLKKFALDNCMSTMARDNHLNNEIYIHKLNCA